MKTREKIAGAMLAMMVGCVPQAVPASEEPNVTVLPRKVFDRCRHLAGWAETFATVGDPNDMLLRAVNAAPSEAYRLNMAHNLGTTLDGEPKTIRAKVMGWCVVSYQTRPVELAL